MRKFIINYCGIEKISIIGLGYVGVPLAVEFGKCRPVAGFDINPGRIRELESGHNSTREVSPEETSCGWPSLFTADIADCNCYIVTVPTPIDEHKAPRSDALLAGYPTMRKVTY